MGKKVLLSLGGAIPTNQSINNDESAVAFAKFLWNAFGPEDATYDGPRPFGDAVVDGFDFDIESEITGNDPASQYRGYGTMVDTLRIFFAAGSDKEYYISAAPQCVIPDAHLSQPIETAWFDFLFVQFYNTPQCSARAYFDASYGRVGDRPSSISFDAWVNFVRTKALNKDVKLYIGLPAAPAVTYDPKMYIAPDDVYNLIDLFQCRYPKDFGGIMVYEATYSEQNLIDNKPFAAVVKSQLTDHECAKPATLTSSTVSSTSTSSSLSVHLSTANTSSPTSTPASMAGMHNSTFTVGPTAPIITGSSPIQPYNSTGIWSGTSSNSVNIGTGSLTPSYPTSTGIWNGTSTAISIIGTGSSSIPLHPTTTGIRNGTSSSSTIIGIESSSIPSYPTSTGIWNTTTSMLPSGTGYASSSVPVNSSTSTSSQTWMSSQASSSSRVSNNKSISTSSYSATTISFHPTGEPSGVSSLVSSTSVPYPIDNSSSSAQTPTSSGVVYTTETITITQCPPEVTSCLIRTSVTIHPITSSSSDSISLSSSALVTASSNPPDISSSGDSVFMSSSAPVTSTTTNSPGTTTSSTQTPTLTGVSYTTETITVTDCSPEVTSCPVRTSVTIYPIGSLSSVPVISSSSAPVTSASANNPETTRFMTSKQRATTFM
ncbi:MAG: hypothetical protein LQ337_003157 [Flavoplaca oasis]|nr:MAG: hypothetical protein LQ337_003157 [Flavoplaca oasis]